MKVLDPTYAKDRQELLLRADVLEELGDPICHVIRSSLLDSPRTRFAVTTRGLFIERLVEAKGLFPGALVQKKMYRTKWELLTNSTSSMSGWDDQSLSGRIDEPTQLPGPPHRKRKRQNKS